MFLLGQLRADYEMLCLWPAPRHDEPLRAPLARAPAPEHGPEPKRDYTRAESIVCIVGPLHAASARHA